MAFRLCQTPSRTTALFGDLHGRVSAAGRPCHCAAKYKLCALSPNPSVPLVKGVVSSLGPASIPRTIEGGVGGCAGLDSLDSGPPRLQMVLTQTQNFRWCCLPGDQKSYQCEAVGTVQHREVPTLRVANGRMRARAHILL